jgi:hypothetical protein
MTEKEYNGYGTGVQGMKIPCGKPQGIFVGEEIYYTGDATPRLPIGF